MDYYLYGEVTAQTAREIAQAKITTVHINSAGGDIFSALAIYNLLKNKNVTAQIEGLCASAATIISSACKVKMAENALFMVHLPLVGLVDFFSSEELAKFQNSLQATENSILMIYRDKTGRADDELLNLMKAESWLDAEKAKELGFVDEITQAVEIKNDGKLLMEKYKNSVLTEERGRVAALMALKCDSPAINSIINKAIENGDGVEKITPYINAIKNAPQNTMFKNMVEDNLNSGAENVQGSLPVDKKQEQINLMSELIKRRAAHS